MTGRVRLAETGDANGKRLYHTSMSKSRVSEEADSAFDNIAQRLAGAGRNGIRTLSLVSAIRGEGTSTCALNLARYLAGFQRQDVLLVDANLRDPALHGVLEEPATAGLSDLISGQTDLESAVRDTGTPHLHLLPSGSPVAHPNRLLNTLDIESLLNPAGQAFRFVIFDTPALNLYPDALQVAWQCDGVALVVQAEKTRRETILHAKSELSALNCNIIGVILNRRKFHIPEFLYKLV